MSAKLIRVIKFFVYLAVLMTPIFYFKYSVYPEILPKEAFFQTCVEAAFFLWLALVVLDSRYRPKFTPLMKALLVFVAILVLTSVLGVDPARSFWSTYERSLGVVAILHLVALALMIASLGREINWRKLLYWSLVTAFITDVIAWLQLGNPNLLLIEPVGNRPGATFGNPTFLAGYLLMNIFAAAYLFLYEWREAKNENPSMNSGRQPRPKYYWPLLISVLANAVTIFITQTRGDILGLGLGAVALAAIFAVRPPAVSLKILNKRALYAGLLIILVVIAGAFWFTRSSGFWSRVPGLDRFKDISLALSSSDIQPRLIAWRAAWQGFLEKPFLGWGFENYNIVFNKFYDPRALEFTYQETRFDKPHNFVLEYLVTGGLPLFLSYFAVWIFLVWEAFKTKDRLWGSVIAAALVAYFARNLFVFETIGPMFMFYVFVGVSDGEYRGAAAAGDAARADQEKPLNRPRSYLVYGAVAAALATMYFVNFSTVEASYHEYWGYQNLVNHRVGDGLYDFKQSVTIWSPYRWNIQRDYATAVAEAYFYNPGLISDAEAEESVRAFEEARDAHPLDAYNHYALVDLYNQVSAIDPAKYTELAEAEAQEALKLSPNRQEVYFSLAKTKTIEGDKAAALGVLKYALNLDTKVPDAHFYYGLLAFATGDNATGYNEIETAVQMGRPWKNYYEPRTVAGYFGEAGHLEEARDLYLKALELAPGGNDLESEIKLAVVYFMLGDRNSARDYFQKVIDQGFDFKTSPAYGELKPFLDNLGL